MPDAAGAPGRNMAERRAVYYSGMRTLVQAGTVVLAGAMGAGCVVHVDSQGQIAREERRYQVSGIPELRLDTFDGAIQIQSWERPEVLVEIEKRGATKEAIESIVVNASQSGGTIEIDCKAPRQESFRIGFGVGTQASLMVSLPAQANIVARTGDGAIGIERVNGRIELRTGDGSITASHVSGDLILGTGDGTVRVEDARGTLALETGDGGVNVGGQLSAVRIHTGDGSVVYRAEPGTSMSADWNITSGDGSISLFLPPGFNGELDASTGDGTIKSDLDAIREALRDRDRRSLRARLGNGGRLVRIHTGDGAISLRQR